MALTYDKMGGFATTEGQELEINLSALLILRGLNNDLDFQLGTNVQGAGALDDVVFRYRTLGEEDTWTTLYVQLKYKATRMVTRNMLTSTKGDFSLPKYLESYLDIKKAMSTANHGTLFDGNFDKSLFVIFTNTKACGLSGQECSDTLSEAEKFVSCDSGKVFSFEKDEDILKCLAESGDEGQEFLGRLRLFCEQPDANLLKVEIKRELQKLDPEVIQGVDLESLLNEFLRRVKAWWEKKDKAEVLNRDNDLLRSLVLEVISQRTKKDYKLDLDFEEDILASLRVSVTHGCKVVNVQASESSCRLSLTKLCEAFGGQPLVLDCEGLLANQEALRVQWKGEADKEKESRRKKEGKDKEDGKEKQQGNEKEEGKEMEGGKEKKGRDGISSSHLIICTNDWTPSLQAEYLNVVKDLLAIRDTPPIVFLSNYKNSACGAIANEFQESVKSFEDKFLFSQLKEASRGKVLAKEVFLQGHSTTFSKFFDDASGAPDKVLDACSVVEILDCVGCLILGDAFDEGIDFYVDRHLEMSTVVKDTVFQDGALRETVTVRVMQCDEGNVELARLSATGNRTGLFDKAIGFLSSLKDSKSLLSINTEQTVSDLSNSLLFPDEGNPEVFIGPTFTLGPFKCNSVGLRFGQQGAVTALQVRSSKHSTQAGFLFVSDKTSENDARKLSDFHQSKHLLSLKNGQLRWIRSHGDIEWIRPHIDKTKTIAPGNAMDVEDRLVLVCAEPGMGKSTLMARLAKKTKAAHPHHFVFLIPLNDQVTLFAQDGHKEALGFLCSAYKIESHVHRSLLKFALEESGHVVVLFDGFDEIAPKYVKESCVLFESLMEGTKTSKVWITSRNSVKTQLETRISKIAMTLLKFTSADQEIFLKRFWASNSKLSDKDLGDFIKRLIEITSHAVRDRKKDLMGIPLQTRMLAEVYEGHVTGSGDKSDLPIRLDLLELLEKFVDKKFRVYFQSNMKVLSDSARYENIFKIFFKSYIKSHSNAGLVLILGDDIVNIQQMESVKKKFLQFSEKIKSGEEQTEFIDSIVDGKPRFIHRVFAEYFVAKWISKNFEKYRELVESKMFTENFTVIRNICDMILAKDCILHTAVINENLEEVRTLLEREDVHVDAKDGGGRTPMHLAASLGTSRYQEKNKKRGEILDLLISKTTDFDQGDKIFGGSPVNYADVTRSWVAVDRLIPYTDNKEQLKNTLENVNNEDTLRTILHLDLHNIVDLFLQNGLEVKKCLYKNNKTLLHFAAELESPDTLRVLLEALDAANRADIINSQDNDGNSVLMYAAIGGCLKSVTYIVMAGGKLTQVNNEGRTPLMTAVRKDHQVVVKHLLNNFNEEKERMSKVDYINMKDNYGADAHDNASLSCRILLITTFYNNTPSSNNENNNPLHFAAATKNLDALRVLLEALDVADRADVVNSQDNKGNSVLMCAAWGGCINCVSLAVKTGGKLTQVNNDGRTPLMVAAQEGHLEVVKYFLNNYNEDRENMTKHDYINMGDKKKATAIFFAAWKGYSAVSSLLLDKGGDPLSRDCNNITPLHNAALFKHLDALRVLLEAVDVADRADAVNLQDNDGYSVLMFGALGGCVENVQMVVQAGGKVNQVNNIGGTPLMVAAKQGHQEVVAYFLNNFDDEKENMTGHAYINMEDDDGNNAIHFAAQEGQSAVISLLLDRGGDPLCCDSDNITPLHAAAKLKYPEALRVLLEALDEADRADAVNSQNNDGDSVLMRGAWGGCVENVRMVVEAGGKLSQKNNNGHTPLMVEAVEGHQEVVEYLLNNFDDVGENMMTRDYINMAAKKGNTAINLAAWKGHSAVINLLLAKGGDPLSRDCNNTTPLHTAAAFKHSDALRVLLEALDEADRADSVNLQKNNGNSVLMCGAWGGCVENVRMVVEAGGKLTQENIHGHTPLMVAAQEGHQEVVEYLLHNFDDVRENMTKKNYINMATKMGNTAIYFAAWKGHSAVISLLLGKGGDPLSRDSNNTTPLHTAAAFKHSNALRVLLEALDEADRADAVNSKDNDGASVLMYGAWGGCVNSVRLVVEAGGKLAQVNNDGRSPLMEAAQEGHQEVAEYLLNNFDDVGENMTTRDYINMGDKDGITAIHFAAQNGHLAVINLLLGKGGNPLSRDRNNNSPLHAAAEYRHSDALRVLLEVLDEADRADVVNSKGYDGDSVLSCGALGGCVISVRMVVEAGGKLTQVNSNRRTPLMAAAEKGHLEVIEYLLNNFDEERENMTILDLINMEDKDGKTAFDLASLSCEGECCEILLAFFMSLD